MGIFGVGECFSKDGAVACLIEGKDPNDAIRKRAGHCAQVCRIFLFRKRFENFLQKLLRISQDSVSIKVGTIQMGPRQLEFPPLTRCNDSPGS